MLASINDNIIVKKTSCSHNFLIPTSQCIQLSDLVMHCWALACKSSNIDTQAYAPHIPVLNLEQVKMAYLVTIISKAF